MAFYTRKQRPADKFTTAEVAFLITLADGGGGALTFLTATGTVDDSNKTFTFLSLPGVIVINGTSYQQTGGAITWTWNAGILTATLSSAVGAGGSIFGMS